MAITNAQQYKQLMQNGGRIGFKGGADMGTVSTKDREATAKSVSISPSGNVTTSTTKDPDPVERDTGLERKRQQNIKDLKTFKETKPPVKFPKFTPSGFITETFFKKPLQKFSNFTTAKNRAFFENVIRAGKIPGVTFADLQNPNFDLEEEYQEYMGNRMAGKTDAYGNPVEGFSYDSEGNLVGNFRGDGPDPIPFIPPVVSQPEEQVTEYVNPLSLLTPRIAGTRFLGTEFEDDIESAADGGRIGAMGGGIMNTDVMGGLADGGMDESGRQMYFLGKLVKKAGRAIKKITKSPIGKAALLGAGMFGIPGTSFGGILGKGAFSKFIGQKAMTQAPFAKGTGILGFLQAKPMASIFGVSALAGLMTPKEDDDELDIDAYYAANRLNPNAPLNRRILGTDFYAADGGMPSKEPVAKKTMPLLDMDGQEMDLRAEGGFVPLGRMERADDVPARLSKNEFVFTADAVRNAGEGDIDKGAEVMYNMMKNLEFGGEVSEESQGLEGAREMFQTSQRLEEVI